jgi:cation:H+ antiporter
MEIVLLVAGLGALLVGAELLVRGASRLAALFGITPLVIGLTIVAFGTSAPELAVSLQAAFTAHAGLTVGNIVGSNTYNVVLVLGLSAVIAPLVVKQQLVRLDVPLMIGASLVFWLAASDGAVSQIEGLLMVGLLVAYLMFVLRVSKRERADVLAEYEQEFGYQPGSVGVGVKLRNAALIAGGLALLVLGAGWLVDGAVGLARGLGVSELLIGLTVVAVGTSTPELVTSVVAALRGERDIAVGNVVGSNIFNLLSVLGITAVIAADGVPVEPTALALDIPFMVAVAVACLPLFASGRVIGRIEGLFLLVFGLAYTALIVAVGAGMETPPLVVVGLLLIGPLAWLSLLHTRRV